MQWRVPAASAIGRLVSLKSPEARSPTRICERTAPRPGTRIWPGGGLPYLTLKLEQGASRQPAPGRGCTGADTHPNTGERATDNAGNTLKR